MTFSLFGSRRCASDTNTYKTYFNINKTYFNITLVSIIIMLGHASGA